MRLIDADALELSMMTITFGEAMRYCYPCVEVKKAIKNAPTIETERQKGRWFILDNCANSGIYCSECQKKVFKEDFSDTVKKYNYCPNCGSYNKGDKHENQKG